MRGNVRTLIAVLHGLIVLLLIEVTIGGLERKGLRPEKRFLATRTVHVIAATILLNLDVAKRTEFHELGVFYSPVTKELIVLEFTGTTLLIEKAKVELLLAAVRVDAEAVLLGKVTTFQGARIELTIVLKLSESLVEGEAIKLIPGDFINELLDLSFVDNLSASKVRALDTNHFNDIDDDRDAIARDNRNHVMKTRGAADLDTKVASDTVEAEAMTAIKSCNQGVKFAEADTAFVLRAARSEIERESSWPR